MIRESLRLLEDGDQHAEALRADVRDGFNAVERGEFVDYDETNISELVSRVKARGLKRLEDEALKTGPR